MTKQIARGNNALANAFANALANAFMSITKW